MKKIWIIVIALLAVSGLAVGAVLLLSGGGDFAVNQGSVDAKLPTAPNFALYSGDGIGFSFLYPADRSVGWRDGDGAYLYGGAEGQTPYVLICRAEGRGVNPKGYFADCDALLTESFASVQSTAIQEVKLGDKTLYLVRYLCDGLVVDRYLELYDGFYIQYTAISDEQGSLNTELYYAITTLRVNEGAYAGAFTKSVTRRSHEDLPLQMDLPDMLETKDLTIGYFASSDDAVLLALWITEDDDGKAIYNRQDFIDRAAEAPGFVAGLLGADTADFSQGQEMTLGGRNFYCYPMEMRSGDEAYTGELCLANADETGCWLVCCAVRTNCPAYEATLTLLKNCAQSIDLSKGEGA